MTTSPAGGWRSRVHDAQTEATRLGGAAFEAARERASASWAWLSANVPPLLARIQGRLTVLGQTARTRAVAIETVARPQITALATTGVARARQALERPASAIEVAGARVEAQPGDDLATILGRLDAAPAADIVLVAPRGVAALRTAAAWVRIAGHARRQGLAIAVVSTRSEVRRYARQSGIRAARTSRGLLGGGSTIPFTGLTVVWPSVLTLAGGVFVLAAGILYTVPTARIEVAPPSQPIEADLLVRVNPLASTFDVPGRTLPALAVQRTVRAVVSAPATGSVRVGDRPALVRVDFRNAGPGVIELPKGTVVRDEARRGFTTVDPIRIEAGEAQSVDAIAMRPGTVGNIPPNSLKLVDDGPEGLTVSNPTPGHGGSDRATTGVSQADVDRVHRLAEDVLTRVALRQLQEEYAGGLVISEGASVAMLAQQPLQQLDEASEVFSAEYVGRASVPVVLPDVAAAFAERFLAPRVPSGRALVPGAARFTFAAGAPGDAMREAIPVHVSSATVPRLDSTTLAGDIAGSNPADARALLRERLHLDADPEVTLGPVWLPWPWLPRRASQIEFVVAPAQPPKAAATAP